MTFNDLSREETVKSLKRMKRRATVPTLKNKGATFALNQGLFQVYLDMAKERFGPDIHNEVFDRA